MDSSHDRAGCVWLPTWSFFVAVAAEKVMFLTKSCFYYYFLKWFFRTTSILLRGVIEIAFSSVVKIMQKWILSKCGKLNSAKKVLEPMK